MADLQYTAPSFFAVDFVVSFLLFAVQSQQGRVHWKNHLLIDFSNNAIEVVALREGTHCNFFFQLQSGLSRELFEQWCTDRRNGVIIAGYCVEGTLAKVK